MTDLQRALAANLKGFRRLRAWAQSDLAEHGEVSVSYIGDLETGAKWPSADVLERLARALSVKPYELFLDAAETMSFHAWLEKRDVVAELGEQLWQRLENRLP